MQAWFQVDVGHLLLEQVWPLQLQLHPLPADVREFATTLVQGVAREREAIDQQLEQYSAHWRLSRMAAVDRNILRIATYELLHCPDIPIRVTLNEAIEMAKTFGSEESSSFVNGILDQIAKTVNKPEY